MIVMERALQNIVVLNEIDGVLVVVMDVFLIVLVGMGLWNGIVFTYAIYDRFGGKMLNGEEYGSIYWKFRS